MANNEKDNDINSFSYSCFPWVVGMAICLVRSIVLIPSLWMFPLIICFGGGALYLWWHLSLLPHDNWAVQAKAFSFIGGTVLATACMLAVCLPMGFPPLLASLLMSFLPMSYGGLAHALSDFTDPSKDQQRRATMVALFAAALLVIVLSITTALPAVYIGVFACALTPMVLAISAVLARCQQSLSSGQDVMPLVG